MARGCASRTSQHGTTSWAVSIRASEWASRMTYREASTGLRAELRTAVSGQRVHRWVQARGEAVEERELILPLAPAARSAPEVVVAEGDDTLGERGRAFGDEAGNRLPPEGRPGAAALETGG